MVSIDNFYTGARRNRSHLRQNPNFESIRHDVTIPLYLEVDGIFNLACPVSPIHYQNDPVQTLKTSVHEAINVLGLAKRTKAKILKASTSEIYGDPEVHPQTEDYWGRVNPIGVRACNDEGKRAAETLFFDYDRQHGLDIRVARVFNAFGPRMKLNDGQVITNFISQALQNQPIAIYGDGKQTRSFCYMDDLIEGLITFFCTERIYKPVNLGNPPPITMLHLAKEIVGLTNSKSDLIFGDLPGDDARDREPDISKAKGLLGWNPLVSRTVGLEKLLRI